MEKFPHLFEKFLQPQGSNDIYFENELFPGRVGMGCIDEVTKWLKEQPHSNAERRSCGSQIMEKETIETIIAAVNELQNRSVKSVKLQVKPHLLHKPGLHLTSRAPDARSTFNMFDRVVVSRESYSVPLGFKGTIISIHRVTDSNPVKQENVRAFDMFYDVLFDEEFLEGQSIYGLAVKRVFRVPQSALINLSFGLGKYFFLIIFFELNLINFFFLVFLAEKDQDTQSSNQNWRQQQTEQMVTPQNAWTKPLQMSGKPGNGNERKQYIKKDVTKFFNDNENKNVLAKSPEKNEKLETIWNWLKNKDGSMPDKPKSVNCFSFLINFNFFTFLTGIRSSTIFIFLPIQF